MVSPQAMIAIHIAPHTFLGIDSAPSPSSYAFAPDSIRSQHRLQPVRASPPPSMQPLLSLYHVTSAPTSPFRQTQMDMPFCTSCATQLAENDAIATLQPQCFTFGFDK